MQETNWLMLYQDGISAGQESAFELAINKFSQCINMDKNNPAVFILRSNAYYSLGQYKEALSDVYSALAIDQSISDAYSMKGLLEWTMGDLQSALADYNKAISIDSNDSIIFMNRGQVKYDSGDLDGAISDCIKSTELDRNNSSAHNLIHFYKTMKDYPELHKSVLEKKTKK